MSIDKRNTDQPFSDEEKFRDLYRKFYFRLFSFSMQYTNDKSQSEDLIHEVFLKCWEKRDELHGNAVESLLFTMTRNLCLNYVKHLKVIQNKNINLEKTGQWEELYRIEFVKDEPYILIEKELQEMILKILNTLPQKCKEVFRLSRLQGMKNREIAEKLGISTKTVEKHLQRALHEFRTKLPALVPIAILVLVIANNSPF